MYLLKSLMILVLFSSLIAEAVPLRSKGGITTSKKRERVIVREAKVRRDKKDINFEETAISGSRNSPLGSMVSQNKPDKDFDLVKIRTSWHSEMVQSTSSLEAGRGQ